MKVMNHKIFISAATILFIAFTANGQNSTTDFISDTVLVNKLLDESKTFINSEPEKSVQLNTQAKKLSEQINFPKGEALALKNIGLAYYYQGQYLQTLDFWTQSLRVFQKLNDLDGMANLHGNIGAVFYKQGDEVNALKHHLESLKIAEKANNKLRIFFALNNIGGIYSDKKAWDKALTYLLRSAPIAEESGDKSSLALILGNIGEIYYEKGQSEERKSNQAQAKNFYKEAKDYYNKALSLDNGANNPFALNGLGKIDRKQGHLKQALRQHQIALEQAKKFDENHIVPSLQGIADVYIDRKDYNSALGYYTQAETIAEQQKAYPVLKDLYQQMALTYANLGSYSKAFTYQINYDRIKDTLFNELSQKKLNSLQFEFDLEKKQGEINLLSVDKALKETELKRQTVVRNAFGAGLLLILIIAYIIFRNYRQKAKINKVLDRQKAEIEELLLNILPSEVATELQTTGNATPKSYSKVSVLFTDFKGFTSIADQLEPEVLVSELNNCFTAFDNIIEKHRLEKIKTIGDSYMCAGGIPTPDDNHEFRMLRAAMEIQDYVYRLNEQRRARGSETWDIRIGVHVGAVVAGVVGKKKYAYDIWGRAVNIASRMESSGVPGQVNISAATYQLVKDKFACIYRGKIHAKGVGEIDMYLVDHEITTSEKFTEKTDLKPVSTTPVIIPG